MGAWGTGIFDNDTACDWAYTLEESDDLSVVEQTLEKVISAGFEYLEAPEAEEALAAAEVIARLQGNYGDRNAYTEIIDKWVLGRALRVSPELVRKTLLAIERVLTEPSELVELWKESEDFDAWKASISNLSSRIRA